MEWIEKLEKMIGSSLPVEQQRSYDWAAVELALSVSYPDDFKTFSVVWGHGKIADFIHFFQPDSKKKALRLPHAVQGFVNSYATLKSHYPHRYPMEILPAVDAFLPFAITDNGDYLGWIAKRGATDHWTVAILEDEEGQAVETGLVFSEFLLKLADKSLRPEALPDDFWAVPLTFERYSPEE